MLHPYRIEYQQQFPPLWEILKQYLLNTHQKIDAYEYMDEYLCRNIWFFIDTYIQDIPWGNRLNTYEVIECFRLSIYCIKTDHDHDSSNGDIVIDTYTHRIKNLQFNKYYLNLAKIFLPNSILSEDSDLISIDFI